MKIKFYTMRLAVALLALTFAIACSAVLDADDLASERPDASIDKDAIGPGSERTVDLPQTPLEAGTCKNGKVCILSTGSLKGRCKYGAMICDSSGTSGVCQANFQKIAEKCDRIDVYYDHDCDGVYDHQDKDAHTACGSGRYCAKSATGNTATCKSGCADVSFCSSSANKCTNHVCLCGTGPACTRGNQCVSGNCRCGSGPACTGNTTCSSGTCVTPPDAGTDAQPDKGADLTVDQAVDQAPPLPDQTIQPDQPVQPDQTVQPDQAAPQPDQATPQPDLSSDV